MSTSTTRNVVPRKRALRGAAVSVLCATAFAGLVAAPAQAADSQWTVRGPNRTNMVQANADIPATEAECRRQDGVVVGSYLTGATENGTGAAIFYARVICQAKRV